MKWAQAPRDGKGWYVIGRAPGRITWAHDSGERFDQTGPGHYYPPGQHGARAIDPRANRKARASYVRRTTALATVAGVISGLAVVELAHLIGA